MDIDPFDPSTVVRILSRLLPSVPTSTSVCNYCEFSVRFSLTCLYWGSSGGGVPAQGWCSGDRVRHPSVWSGFDYSPVSYVG